MVKNRIFVLVFLCFFLVSFFYINYTVFASKHSPTPINEPTLKSTPIVKAPEINARHAIILDRNSKNTLYSKKEQEICKMASTTKIMTAIIVIENANLKDTVSVSSKAARTGGSRLGLSSDDTITVENLLYGLMMRSRK